MRIFFSFSLRLDKYVVDELSKALKDFGYEPIIPIDRHIHVHNWRSRLVEALRKSDGAVIILTPENGYSPYVMGELWAARLLSQINKRFVLVPVWYSTSKFPEHISDLYVVNIDGKFIGNFKQLAAEIHNTFVDIREFEVALSDLKHHIFIGHGHDSDWKEIAKFIDNELHLAIEEYYWGNSPIGYTVIAHIEKMLDKSSLAIIVMSPEDVQQDDTLRARQNVIHEIGLCQGRLGFEKVILLRHKNCESFSNISGINEIQYDSSNWDEVFKKIRDVVIRERLLNN